MEFSGDDIADVVLRQFNALPAKRKPQVRGPGSQEWVPLSGIVAQRNNKLKCIAAATGMKCLPQYKIPNAQGIVLHDWHAEILAIRSLNRFLLEECHALASSSEGKSDYVRFRTDDERTEQHFQPFALSEDIRLHMYCSEAPCGDASMELTIAAQADPTPWPSPAEMSSSSTSATAISSPVQADLSFINPTKSSQETPTLLHGRAYFSSLGIVRRKPSRPDSPPTLSKSCSDKLAHMQCTTLLSSPLSLLMSPSSMYLSTLTLPESQYSATSCTRAFSAEGRMAGLISPFYSASGSGQNQPACEGMQSYSYGPIRHWSPLGYTFKPFSIFTTTREFAYSRRQGQSTSRSDPSSPTITLEPTASTSPHHSTTSSTPPPYPPSTNPPPNLTPAPKLIPSNLSTAHTPTMTESLIGGVLQGRKQSDIRGASKLCRRRIWSLSLDVALLLLRGSRGRREGGEKVAAGVALDRKISAAFNVDTYREVKATELLEGRRRVKGDVRRWALKGWIGNSGGDEFGLDGVQP